MSAIFSVNSRLIRSSATAGIWRARAFRRMPLCTRPNSVKRTNDTKSDTLKTLYSCLIVQNTNLTLHCDRAAPQKCAKLFKIYGSVLKLVLPFKHA